MKKVIDYRKHADDCLRLAKQMEQADHREMLLKMADTWLKMAQERAAEIEKKPSPPRHRTIN